MLIIITKKFLGESEGIFLLLTEKFSKIGIFVENFTLCDSDKIHHVFLI